MVYLGRVSVKRADFFFIGVNFKTIDRPNRAICWRLDHFPLFAPNEISTHDFVKSADCRRRRSDTDADTFFPNLRSPPGGSGETIRELAGTKAAAPRHCNSRLGFPSLAGSRLVQGPLEDRVEIDLNWPEVFLEDRPQLEARLEFSS